MLLLLGACAVGDERYDRAHLAERLKSATGFAIPASEDELSKLPPDVDDTDGLDESEAVATALWNNPGFREATTLLGLRRADLVAAGVLRNPMLSVFFPLGPKQLEFTLNFPIEALFLRPSRVRAAELDCEAVARQLVLNGMDLVRDVRRACADLRLAHRLRALAAADAAARQQAEDLIATRVREGEAAPLELDNADVERRTSERLVVRAEAQIRLAGTRLRALLGLPPEDASMRFTFAVETAEAELVELLAPSVTWTVAGAYASRPDLRAAELAADAARERADISDWEWLRVSPLLDANGKGLEGFEMGPGLLADLPLFDHGQGRSMQAMAQLEAAVAAVVGTEQRIALEVAQARATFDLAAAEVRMLAEGEIPAAETAVSRAATTVRLGDAEPLLVVAAELRLLQARQQCALAVNALRNARAELERSCACPAVPEPPR